VRSVLVAGLLLLTACSAQKSVVEGAPEPEPQAVAPVATLVPEPGCSNVQGTFAPTGIRITGLDLPVLALPRDSRNVPGVPPLSAKFDVAWDEPGVWPGEPRGNVLLNTHTWPDGSALGNRFLADLHEGDRFILTRGASRLCYQVTDRIEVPVDHAPLARVYDTTGRPQAVIIVCSGTRLGPEQWTKRTLWFASPVT
jgi:hypothetical protein